MKSFIILIFIIFNIKFNQAIKYPVVQSQNATAIDIFKNLLLFDVSDLSNFEICGMFMYCSPSIAEPGFYEINSISIRGIGNIIPIPIEIIQDFSVFTILVSLDAGEDYTFGETFFNNLPNLLSLRSLNIGRQQVEIPVTTTFPQSLYDITFQMISVPLPICFFESESLFTICILNSNQGFTLPTLTNVNNFLTTFKITISSYSSISSDMGNYLTNVNTLHLSVDNDELLLEFPDLSSFKTLNFLKVIFNNDKTTYSTFPYPQSIVNLPITSLTFEGLGFIIGSNLDKYDLSNGNNSIELNIDKGGPSISYIALPKRSKFMVSDTDFNLSLVDYSNIIHFSCWFNLLNQTLPIINNPFNIDSFEITKSNVYGSIPQNYCQFKNINIADNQLGGTIPTCFTCLGGIGSGILPNNFISFNTSTEPECPDFKVNNEDVFITPTYGGNITLTGVNIGWDLQISCPLLGTNIQYDVVIPNEKIEIIIQPGTGYGYELSIKFDNGITQIIKLNFTAPLINYYTVKQDGEQKVLKIHGIGFNYNNNNNINVDGNLMYFGSPINDTLSTYDIEWEIGSKHELFINVGVELTGIQKSNIISFYYYPDIQISNEQINILDNTGSILINGSFVNVTDLSLVTISINNINCIVNSISSTFINITYPSISTTGNNEMSINIGGNNLFKTVNIIKSTQSPSPTPTSTPPSPTQPSNSDSSDDQPSVSSKLSISLFNIILLFIISSSLLLK